MKTAELKHSQEDPSAETTPGSMPEDAPGGELLTPGRSEQDLILEWFRLLARRRTAWLQHIWTAEGTLSGMADGRATVTHAELAGLLADQDSPVAEAAWQESQEPIVQWNRAVVEIEQALDSSPNSRLLQLAHLFGLTGDELDLLQLCAAVAFDPALARVCAYLQDHSGRPYMTELLAVRLLGIGRSGPWVSEMNLFRWNLIRRRETGVGEPQALICDPQIKEWLLGRRTLDDLLVGATTFIGVRQSELPEWPVKEIADWIDDRLMQRHTPPIRVLVVAPHGGGKQTFAAAVLRQLRMPGLVVNAGAVEEANWPQFFLHAQRQAFLDGSALVWTGEVAARRAWPTTQALFPVQFVLCQPGVDVLPMPGVADRLVHLPMPDIATRERLWRLSSPQAAQWEGDELKRLAEQHNVWPGDIERASLLGAHTSSQAGQLVREAVRYRFGHLAQILDCSFTPGDLVVPNGVTQQLEAIAFEAEKRVAFWQQPEARRLFPQGRGLVALFSGPPGTGKTMAAQVIAARLGQDLCRVNVAQLVSKWVGETAKNCEQVIRLAADANVILFFDEADALFSRRATEIRDAQDKFANTDAAFLLQAIESYPGIAILATNLKSNIDPAFVRRLRYVVEFPKPDVALQKVLWQKLVAGLAGDARAQDLTPALDVLSQVAEATGSQIKFAVLGGLFAAQAERTGLAVRHLLTGLDRELGKEGRSIGKREREHILKVAERR